MDEKAKAELNAALRAEDGQVHGAGGPIGSLKVNVRAVVHDGEYVIRANDVRSMFSDAHANTGWAGYEVTADELSDDDYAKKAVDATEDVEGEVPDGV